MSAVAAAEHEHRLHLGRIENEAHLLVEFTTTGEEDGRDDPADSFAPDPLATGWVQDGGVDEGYEAVELAHTVAFRGPRANLDAVQATLTRRMQCVWNIRRFRVTRWYGLVGDPISTDIMAGGAKGA